MRDTPRQRALAALDEIDTLAERGISAGGHSMTRHPALDRAYRELAAAMNAEFGALAPESGAS